MLHVYLDGSITFLENFQISPKILRGRMNILLTGNDFCSFCWLVGSLYMSTTDDEDDDVLLLLMGYL